MSDNVDAKGYYKVLEVTPNAPLSLIKQQYYDRAKYWHPDHNDNPNAVEIFQKISVAYNLLKDQKNRLKYDLLSIIYNDKDFPDMDSLNPYKNQAGQDDAALRVLKQRRITAFFTGFQKKETKDICNFSEAKDMVVATSVANWLRGWWGAAAFAENIKALKFNYQAAAAADEDNLKLLIHNAVAYESSARKDLSWIYAKQAMLLVKADSREKELLQSFIDILDYHPQKSVVLPKWSVSELRTRQLLMPVFFAAVAAVLLIFCMGKIGMINLPHKTDSYYKEMILGGERVADDQIESHIIKVDGDKGDDRYIFHLKAAGKIYYGPDSRYDVLKEGVAGQTVRVVGYTPDKQWFKIIIDNGEAGYVNRSNIVKGKGNPVPPRSQVR